VANLRELELAIGHVSRLARSSIATKDPQKSLRSLLRLYSFLVGAWAECRLCKLLHEQFGFSDQERSRILAMTTQFDQWRMTIDTAFRKHHRIPKATLSSRVLGVTHAARRDALQGVIEQDIRSIIEIRNKLAHGQWVFPFNNAGTAVEADKYLLINKENLQTLQLKFSLIGHLADVVHDLVVSQRTFERDFDLHFRRLEQVKKNLVVKSYAAYEHALISSREKFRLSRVVGKESKALG
jgi:hypothetical protein